MLTQIICMLTQFCCLIQLHVDILNYLARNGAELCHLHVGNMQVKLCHHNYVDERLYVNMTDIHVDMRGSYVDRRFLHILNQHEQ